TASSISSDGSDGMSNDSGMDTTDTGGFDGQEGTDGEAGTESSAGDGSDKSDGSGAGGTDSLDDAGDDSGTNNDNDWQPDTETGAAPLTCSEIISCINTVCADLDDPNDSSACITYCQSEAPIEASQAFTFFFQCIGQNCQAVDETEYTACVNTNCSAEYEACIIGAPGGSLDCGGFLGCLNGCATASDQSACQQECINDIESSEVYNTYATLEGCIFSACPAGQSGTPDASCISAAQAEGGECSDELEACILGNSGTLDCGGLLQCIQSCTTPECASDCQGQAQSNAVLGEFQQVAQCLIEACPDQSDNACVVAALSDGGSCFDILTACIDGTL
ncbi:MAG: hypothetical protein VX223_08985, partial [Myxococcota bacterium]|nr:hypothetical protein [Myxococcota bacterium]